MTRIIAAITAGATTFFPGVDSEQVIFIVVAWLLGDSLRPKELLKSKRFWAAVSVTAATFFDIDKELVYVASAWIIGDSIRS